MKYLPIDDFPGASRSVEPSAEACKARCEAEPKCAYFSFWASDNLDGNGSGGCHMSSKAAELTYADGVIGGSVTCDKGRSSFFLKEYHLSFSR